MTNLMQQQGPGVCPGLLLYTAPIGKAGEDEGREPGTNMEVEIQAAGSRLGRGIAAWERSYGRDGIRRYG
ncbi:hypothetical protein D3C81_2100820 [compost metagenome]